MTNRAALVALAAAAVLAAACGGKESCPTTSANAENQNMQNACSAPAPQQVAVKVNLCEACSHTDPTCTADTSSAASGSIFLDAKWEVCTDNSSCPTSQCAIVTCSFSVPNGNYQVHLIDKTGNPTSFSLVEASGSPTCSGSI